jgi:hypothetical protein
MLATVRQYDFLGVIDKMFVHHFPMCGLFINNEQHLEAENKNARGCSSDDRVLRQQKDQNTVPQDPTLSSRLITFQNLPRKKSLCAEWKK